MELPVPVPQLAALRRVALAILLTAPASGCIVKVYQPLSGLHRPVVTDPRRPNFADTELDVHCVPGDGVNIHEAGILCHRVRTLFENQGARVRTHLQAGTSPDEATEPTPDQAPPPEDAEPRLALSVELRVRRVHASTHPLSWALCIATFTLAPGLVETTFAQDVAIRDGTGFLLVRDSLEGRLLTRFGFGPWLGNATFDLWRDDEDKVLKDAAARDLSSDLYRQLTQLVFNAKMHAEVLRQGGAP